MEEKKPVRMGLTVILLIFLIFVIIVMGFFIYKLNIEKELEVQKAEELQAQVDTLTKTSNDLQEKINTVNEITSSVENNILIYDGNEIEAKTGIQYCFNDMEITDKAKNKYNVLYYNYEHGKYEGASNGVFGYIETYDGRSIVTNVKRIAMTEKFDAIPRKFTRTNELPEELKDMADYTSVIIDSIDLDGDGKEEKIVCYTISYEEGEIGDGEPQASSGIILYDSNYEKIADLVSLENGFWGGMKQESYKKFLSLDEAEYIDIDNDNIMEIVLKVPIYEGTCISIYKYNKGNVEGEINYEASVSA